MRRPPKLLWRSSLRYLRTHPWMLLLSILGVAVGVSVVVAIDLANASAERAFRLSTESVAGRATHQLVGGPEGVPDSTFAVLARTQPRIPSAPILEFWARAEQDPTRTIHVLGVDLFSEAPFRAFTTAPDDTTPSNDAPFDLAAFMSGSGGGLLAPTTARLLGLAPSDTLRLILNGTTHAVPVSGLIPAAASGPEGSLDGLFVVDLSVAKRLMGFPAGLSRIDLILEDEATIRSLFADNGVTLVRSEARTETLAQMTAAFKLNLTALSLLALIVGMFLTYNTISFSVVERRMLIGRLRSVGVLKGEILTLILGEALLIGLAGTALGIVLGVVLGQGLVHLVTRTINDLYFVVSVRELHVAPWTMVKGVGLGVGATLLAAWAPGRAAAAAPPGTLLRRSSDESSLLLLLPRLAAAGVLLVLAGILVLVLSQTGIAVAYGGIFMIIMGWALLTPMFIRVAVRLLQRRVWGVIGRMATGSVGANLSRTSVAIAALTIAMASVIGVGVMVGSFRSTVVTWLEGALQADIYVQPPNMVFRSGGARMDQVVVRALRETDGVRSAHGIRHTEIESSVGRVHLAAIETGPHSMTAMKDGTAEQVRPLFEAAPSVIVSEPFAYRHGLGRGDSVHVETPVGTRSLEILGVYYDYASDQGTVMMHRQHYMTLYGDSSLSGLALFVDEQRDMASIMDDLRAAAGDRQELIIQSNRELREYSLDIFDRTFTVTRVLQLLAVIVAFIGILSALMALQLERAKEYAVLRANGMTGGQLGWFVSWQCGFMGLLAGVLAMPLGLALSLALIHVINLRSFGWTLQLEADPMLFVQALVVAVGAALLAGIWPARHMRRLEAAQALRADGS